MFVLGKKNATHRGRTNAPITGARAFECFWIETHILHHTNEVNQHHHQLLCIIQCKTANEELKKIQTICISYRFIGFPTHPTCCWVVSKQKPSEQRNEYWYDSKGEFNSSKWLYTNISTKVCLLNNQEKVYCWSDKRLNVDGHSHSQVKFTPN